MAGSSTTNRSKHRQKKRSRGRKPLAKVGDVTSVINLIHHEEDKFDVAVVNKLGKFYEILLQQAEAKGKFADIGIKDQTKAIEYCVKRAESFLDEYYEEIVETGMTSSDSSDDEDDDDEVKELADVLSLEFTG